MIWLSVSFIEQQHVRNKLKSYMETKMSKESTSEFWYTQIDVGKQFGLDTFSSNNNWFQTNIMSESELAVEAKCIRKWK